MKGSEKDDGKKRKRDSASAKTSNDSKTKELIKKGRDLAKLEFDDEKKAILDSLPPDYTAMFGTIGCAVWQKGLFPVLILDPYEVPPRPVRGQWFEKYEMVSC